MIAVMELPDEGRLLDDIPLSTMGPGEDLHEGLFFPALPDLRHHRVSPARLHGLHPQVAVEQNKGPRNDHGDDLPDAFDGSGEGKALFGPLDSCVGIAEVELCYLDLPDLSKMSVHDQELTGEGRSGPSRLVSRLIRIHGPQMSVRQRV